VASLFRAVRCCAIDAYRRRTSIRADPLDRAIGGEALSAAVDLSEAPIEVKQVFQAIEQLPRDPPFQQIILAVIDGETIASMAVAWKRPQSTINNWLHRARQRLLKCLGEGLLP
jgi:DNA-directed RNA polymerase specialized sigma24 family protein